MNQPSPISVRDRVSETLVTLREADASLNAVRTWLTESAYARADYLDQLPEEDRGPLHGLPVVVKEEWDIEGVVTTYGTATEFTPAPQNSAIVQRVLDAGAVILATTRMPEFGCWPATESATGGITRNPHDLSRTPGGSSGGSAALLAAGAVDLAIGSDGGGSLRIPSAHCGVTALKATPGVFSTAPHDNLWRGMGTPGPMARSVTELIPALNALTDVDFTPEPRPLQVAFTTRSTSPLTPPSRHHAHAVREVAAALAHNEHSVAELDKRLPSATLQFLPRFIHGVADEVREADRPELAEPRTRRLTTIAKVTPQPRPSRAERLADQVDELLDGHDVLVMPTVSSRPGRAGGFLRLGLLGSLLRSTPSISCTSLFNVTGHPAMNVPVGTAPDGLPVGVQIVGRRGDDALVLNTGAEVERLISHN